MRLLFFFLFVTMLTESSSQGKLIYEGKFSVKPGISGTATFEYVGRRDGTKIKSGNFSFHTVGSDSVAHRLFKEMTWKGRYHEDRKNGEWRYHYLTHHLEVLEVKDFKPNYHLDTHQEFIRGVYDKGVPHGPWSLKIELISNYRQNKVISRAEATFKQAKLDNNFYFAEDKDQVTISGKAENGIMVDTWQFSYLSEGQHISENRVYKKGFLTSLVKVNAEGDTLISLDYPLSNEILSYLDSGKNENVLNAPVSLHFSDGYPRKSVFMTAQNEGNAYLDKLTSYLMRHDVDFASEYGLPLGANRMYYPLTPAETDLQTNWVQVFYDYRSKINRLEELARQTVFFEQEDTISLIHHWIEGQRELIDYISPWDNIIMKKEMGYYNRVGMLREYVKNILSADTLTLSNQNTVVSYAPYQGDEESFLFFLDHNMKERTQLADSFLTICEQKNREYRESVNLLAEKRELLRKQEEMHHSLQKMTGDKATDAVLQHLERKILIPLGEEFLAASSDSAFSLNELKLNGQIVREKLEMIQETVTILREIARSKALLEEMYTAYRFDPFTYSENVPYKEYSMLYATYAESIVDNLLKQAASTDTIASIFSNVHMTFRIQQRLVFLSDKDEILRRIEKRLTKRQSEAEQLELLKP